VDLATDANRVIRVDTSTNQGDEAAMPDTLTIGAWISLHEGCEISSDVGGSNVGMMTVRGAGQQPFELYFRAEPLRQLLEVGTRTLAEMDALAAQEEAEPDGCEPASSDQLSGPGR
jgi:hypothetical protein